MFIVLYRGISLRSCSSIPLDHLVSSILAAILYGLGPTLPRPSRTHACPILISHTTNELVRASEIA